jgi:CRP-like cAMP-binding protein
VSLQARQVLALPGEPIWHLYFPRTAVVSLTVPMDDGSIIEGACIGNEGLIGLGAFLGNLTATEHMVVQIGGQAARLPAGVFRETLARDISFVALLRQYMLALMGNISRTAGCNRLHSVQQRCARWLLTSADCVGQDTFPLTHESLAVLLGVRRASVSEAAEMLQRSGLIGYQRGQITIRDRDGLETTACEDYRLRTDAYNDIYR